MCVCVCVFEVLKNKVGGIVLAETECSLKDRLFLWWHHAKCKLYLWSYTVNQKQRKNKKADSTKPYRYNIEKEKEKQTDARP